MTEIFNKGFLKSRRKDLRNNMPKAEWLLWAELRNKKLKGYRFRRQASINSFVVDFYCPQLRLAIEIDGDSHCGDKAAYYDDFRQKNIESLGIKVIRFTNNNVYENIDEVIERIKKFLP